MFTSGTGNMIRLLIKNDMQYGKQHKGDAQEHGDLEYNFEWGWKHNKK